MKLNQNRLALVFFEHRVLLRSSDEQGVPPRLLDESDLLASGLVERLENLPFHNEGAFNEQLPYACGELAHPARIPSEWGWFSLREVAQATEDRVLFGMLSRAYQVIQWDKNHQFCGRCGGKTLKRSTELSRFCEPCGLSFFPRISPSAIVVIKKQDQLLLARSPRFAPGVYGAIAGFVEAGETVENAAIRETQEEVGITITNLRYRRSQPWPFPDSLMLGYTADYLNGEIKVDGVEIEDAKWFYPDSLPKLPMKLSIARSLIEDVVEEIRGGRRAQ